MWEYVEGDWSYYFDFFPDGQVAITENGLRAYQVRDNRTLAIQMLEEEWLITVRALSPERLTLEGVVNAVDDFDRVEGTPNLATEIVGLWLDLTGENPSIEFTANGIAVGDFGRGTYEVKSANSVLIECDVLENCADYLEFGQEDDASVVLRIYEIENDQLSLHGFGDRQQWTLDLQTGFDNLAGDILGYWSDDWGSSAEFMDSGEWIVDSAFHGSYEILSDTTLWTVLQDDGLPIVVMRLTGSELAYADWGFFEEEDWWVFER